MKPNQYAKAIFGGVSMGLGAVAVALNDGVITTSEWVTVAIAVVGAFGVVFGVPNAGAPDVEARGGIHLD